MEAGIVRSATTAEEIHQLLDNILDSVLALKAKLRNSNRDSNSLGGSPRS